MAAEQAEVAANVEADIDERAEILSKVNRTLATIQKSTAELVELVSALSDTARRASGKLDQNGEPTWNFAVKCGVPKDMFLTKKFLDYGYEFGFDAVSMRTLMFGLGTYEGFIKYYQRQAGQKNGKWSNWSLVFMKWVRTEHERKQKAQQRQGGATRFDRQRTRG